MQKIWRNKPNFVSNCNLIFHFFTHFDNDSRTVSSENDWIVCIIDVRIVSKNRFLKINLVFNSYCLTDENVLALPCHDLGRLLYQYNQYSLLWLQSRPVIIDKNLIRYARLQWQITLNLLDTHSKVVEPHNSQHECCQFLCILYQKQQPKKDMEMFANVVHVLNIHY